MRHCAESLGRNFLRIGILNKFENFYDLTAALSVDTADSRKQFCVPMKLHAGSRLNKKNLLS
jgi:hypothetical protein